MGHETSDQSSDFVYARQSLRLASESVARGERPFGALIADMDGIVAQATNSAKGRRDPTEHAEIRAIRCAAATLRRERLSGCTLYASCEPCVMCAATIRWSGLERVVFCLPREAAEEYDFCDVVPVAASRHLLAPLEVVCLDDLYGDALLPFEAWRRRSLSNE